MSEQAGASAGEGTSGPQSGLAKALDATPEFWRTVAFAWPQGFVILDPHGRLVQANEPFFRTVGFARAELVGSVMPFPYWPAGEVEVLRAIFDAALRGEASERELTLVRKGGERFPAHVYTCGVAGGDGVPMCVLATVRDVTEQKRFEETQRYDAQRWRAMAENPYDFVTIVDENYKYLYVNHTAPGIRREDLLGKASPLDFLDAEYRVLLRDALATAFGGATTSCETYSRQIGSWFMTVVTPVFVEDRVTAVSLLTRNITGAKRAEQALRQSEHRLQLALTGGDVGVFDLDVETGEAFCSPRLFEMLGHDCVGDSTIPGAFDAFKELVHPDDAERILSLVGRALSAGEFFDADYRLRRKDGSYGWFHSRGRSVEVNGRARFSGFATDITAKKQAEHEREELETQLRNVQKLDTLGRLAAGLAHDLNNLLVPILGNAQLLATQLPAEGQLHIELDDIVRAASQARDLVSRILVFGRQSEETPAAVHVPALAREAVRFLQTSLPSNIAVTTEIDEHCGAVLGRPGQIQQAVMNLCTNAAQALGTKGGRLGVKVEPFVVDESFARRNPMRFGNAVRITVEDDGPGMTAEVLERAFEPFFTTKPLGAGSGLGLSIVHGIVTKHGGTVLASSRPGSGARFEVYLPSEKEAAPWAGNGAVELDALPDGRKLRVLCVDDEPAVLRVVAHVLAYSGHQVTTIPLPGVALEMLRSGPANFDLLITDQTMPNLTGIELASLVYQLRRDLPVILVSGYAESEWLQSATPNVRLFLRKPFDALELAKAVQRASS